MKVVISNFSAPQERSEDFAAYWASIEKPTRRARATLFDYPVGWGFHILALGIYLMDQGLADEVEFWDYTATRRCAYDGFGILRVNFYNAEDLSAYIRRFGAPDLFINYGREGIPIMESLAGQSFRVHVPCLRTGMERQENYGADCYLVDDESFLDARSMLYIPPVNTRKVFPNAITKSRDFVYLAQARQNKRHDILLDAVRGTNLTGHLHPVGASQLDLSGTHVTTTDLDQTDLLGILHSARLAVYPGDNTSNPAAMWECVAADLPIVVNQNIVGGKYVVVPGMTGELAAPQNFRTVMQQVLEKRGKYQPRAYLMEHWEPLALLNRYLAFFREMGWRD